MEMLIILNVWPHQPWVSMHSFILSACRIPSENLRILESTIAIPNSKFTFQNLHLSKFSHMVTNFSWGIQHDSTIFNPFFGYSLGFPRWGHVGVASRTPLSWTSCSACIASRGCRWDMQNPCRRCCCGMFFQGGTAWWVEIWLWINTLKFNIANWKIPYKWRFYGENHL